jgi:hypothetical protein
MSTSSTPNIAKYKHLIDKSCPDKFSGKVHIHSNDSHLLWCTLNQTDLETNSNKYYIQQLLKHDVMPSFFLISRSGRVGYENKTSFKCILNESTAIQEFKSVFYEKTGSAWEDRFKTDLAKKDGKYMNVEMEIDKDLPEDKTKEEQTVAKVETKMDIRTEFFINLIFDLKMFESTMKSFNLDTSKAPLGKISQNQIKKAYAILAKIQDLVKGTDYNLPETDPVILEINKQYLSLSSSFYTLIPTSHGNSKLPVINNDDMVKTKADLLDVLSQMEVVGNIMAKISIGSSKVWQQYSSMNCQIQPLTNGKMTNLIYQYLANTVGATHKSGYKIKEIYEIDRLGEKEKFEHQRHYGNRQLLWHGSRLSNIAGILSNGLKIAPKEAPVTGAMFGKGVYFASCFTKSANYMHTDSSGNGVMLLCEVVLGECYQCKHAQYITDLPAGKQSTWGMGTNTPDPSGTSILDDGLIIPMGKMINSQRSGLSLQYDEYIVYNVDQIKIRYALILNSAGYTY